MVIRVAPLTAPEDNGFSLEIHRQIWVESRGTPLAPRRGGFLLKEVMNVTQDDTGTTHRALDRR